MKILMFTLAMLFAPIAMAEPINEADKKLLQAKMVNTQLIHCQASSNYVLSQVLVYKSLLLLTGEKPSDTMGSLQDQLLTDYNAIAEDLAASRAAMRERGMLHNYIIAQENQEMRTQMRAIARRQEGIRDSAILAQFYTSLLDYVKKCSNLAPEIPKAFIPDYKPEPKKKSN